MSSVHNFLRKLAVLLAILALNCGFAEIIRWDVSHLNLVTPPSLGDESNSGNTAIGVWLNMQSGEAYVVDDTAGIPGKTSIADGRFQLRWTTWWTPPSSDVVIQGETFLNRIHGTTVAQPNAAAGSPARLGPGEAVPTGTAFRPANFVEMAGSFGAWREQGRGFLAVAFPIGFGLHFGFVDITILADGSIRLNGMAYNSVPNQTLVTEFIGSPAPIPAANLRLVSSTATAVGIEWEDRSFNESGFIIERSLGDGPFTRIATTLPDVTSFLDEGLSAGTVYRYRVIATTGLDAEPSNVIEVTTRSVDAPPLPPASFQVIPISANSLRLTWFRQADDAIGYRIERSLVGGEWDEIALTGPAAVSYTDRGLLPGTHYQYRITAFNGLSSPVVGPVGERTFSVRETVGAESAATAFPGVSGNGVTIGLWDLAPVRVSHTEFQRNNASVVTNRDGGDGGASSLSNHPTHGAGIIVARGANPLALGVAPGASINAFNIDNDQQKKGDYGMQWPGQPNRIPVAISAYGPIRGWNPVTGAVGWVFNARATDGGFPQRDPMLGGYTEFSREADMTAWERPFLLQVRSSGNDRDDGPQPNAFVYASLDDFENQVISVYDPAVHAPMDGGLDGGHFIVSDAAAAKNTLTIGAWSGARRGSDGRLDFVGQGTDFDNWGPTRDGRVKPDLVASGVSVLSAGYASDDAYSTLTGSSQAAPQAAAAAALLIQKWHDSAPHRHLRASTLKALLIHTADDLHHPGPDARTGWGLLNAHAALNQLSAHISDPSAGYIKEAVYVGNELVFPVFINGNEPLKVTLAWTDPAGNAGDPQSTTPRLREDLDLRVNLPDGNTLMPFVLPFALDPTADPDAPALRGDNRVDTVEQIAAAGVSGPALLVVSRKAGSEPVLPFSLVMSGAQSMGSIAPQPTRVVAEGNGVASIRGGGFQLGASVMLIHSSGLEIPAFGVESAANRVVFRHDPLPFGSDWSVRVTNTDGSSATLRWTMGTPAANSFEAWLDQALPGDQRDDPTIAAIESDFPGSGYPLLARFAFGAADPLSFAGELLPRIELVRRDGLWAYEVTYTQRTSMDTAIIVEAASSVTGPWQELGIANRLSLTDLGNGLQRVVWRDPVVVDSALVGRFMRIRVTQGN